MRHACVDDFGDAEDMLGEAQPLSKLADRAPSRSGTPAHPPSSREERALLLPILEGGVAMLLLLPDHASGTSVVPLRDLLLRELNCKYPNCKIVEKLRAPARALPPGGNTLISDATALMSCACWPRCMSAMRRA